MKAGVWGALLIVERVLIELHGSLIDGVTKYGSSS